MRILFVWLLVIYVSFLHRFLMLLDLCNYMFVAWVHCSICVVIFGQTYKCRGR